MNTRSRVDLLGAIFSFCMVGASMWLAIAQPDHDKALDFWMGQILVVIFALLGGSWLHAFYRWRET